MAPRTAEQFEQIRNERRTEILNAALHVFAEKGYNSASVTGIAKRAGISKGLLYNYFESKEEVLRTVARDLFEYAMDLLKMEPGEVITDERFSEIVSLSVDVALQEPQRWRLYMSLAFQPNVAQLLMQEMMPRAQGYMQALSDYFQSKGYEDPVIAMRIFSAMLDGIQLHCLFDPENFPAEAAKKLLITQFT